MIYFKNDYSEGAHPAVLDMLQKTNDYQEDGYGEDSFTKKAVEHLQKRMHGTPDIHLLAGGTQTNMLLISSVLRPHEAVISAESGHIATHEAGAIEATGHKVLTCHKEDGKLTIQDIRPILDFHNMEHMVKPKLVYISNPTELGTIYTKQEVEDLYTFCQNNELYLYLDGARLGNVLVVDRELTLSFLHKHTDAFFLGATKNGALLGEALILNNNTFKNEFRFMTKQRGALLAKGRLLGAQFLALFEDDQYFNNALHANIEAQRIRYALKDLGYEELVPSPTNQIFPILPRDLIRDLEQDFSFYVWEERSNTEAAVRIVTSWATKEEHVDKFIQKVKEYQKKTPIE